MENPHIIEDFNPDDPTKNNLKRITSEQFKVAIYRNRTLVSTVNGAEHRRTVSQREVVTLAIIIDWNLLAVKMAHKSSRARRRISRILHGAVRAELVE